MYDADSLLFCIDMGTTRTRIWETEGEKVWAHQAADLGVRDVAAGESRGWLGERLSELLDATHAQAEAHGLLHRPSVAVAAGMISSGQGLLSVGHLAAPVAIEELARHLHVSKFPGRCDLTLILVPGISTGPAPSSPEDALNTDLMRGEETLCVGLIRAGLLRPNTVLLSLGSHWKWIWIDERERIAGSQTALTGEVIHAVQAHTLLASALPQKRPETLDPVWVDLGLEETRRSGLGRALFCIRLLEQRNQGTSGQRLSFLYGAFLQSESEHLRTRISETTESVLIAGPRALAHAWRNSLAARGIHAEALDEAKKEAAYLDGLRSLLRPVSKP